MADGRIVTFYSYKGGTGRSMALANVAWIFALNGKKVLAIDWDLEAPGLHRYFLPFLDDPELLETRGLIDLFWSYADLVLTPRDSWPPGIDTPSAYADVQRYAVPLEFPFQDSAGCLHFLGAGYQEASYANRVRNFDWNTLYARLGGSEFVESLGKRLRQQYDYTFIDSRTGVADTSGICTVQMPDTVVLCFTYNRQSMKGVEAVAKSLSTQRESRITLLPVAMRAERSVKGYDKARRVARELLEPLMKPQFDPDFLRRYWGACEVPYYADYAFEETLAVFKDLPGQRNTLLKDMVWLAETIQGPSNDALIIPNLEDDVRNKFLRRFEFFQDPGGKRLLNETKLILLGRGGVGKTSLVNRLVHGTFDLDSARTEGIQITQWPVMVDDEEVRLHVWDFGGQEIMHATHQFFLTARSLYFVVLSGREGDQDVDAEYWLKLVASFGGGSPVFVVLNKMGQHRFDVNRGALRQKYPNIREFVATDCEDGRGLEELKQMLLGELSRWDARRVAFPASWFAIKERLAGMSESYLSFDQFRQVCRELGESDEVGQESLAGYLHTLGIALNYKDDPRLRDTHVLNPHWVTGGIYRILNAPLLAERQGVLNVDDLPRILPAEDYPRTMHLFLLDLMRKFELCFPFPDDTGRYLVPELLDKQQAAEVEQFKPDDCLGFEYHYPILPEGLLPRFIVRTHSMSEGKPRWRSGVILEFEGWRALVKADVLDKKVQVLISGPPGNRRRLLAVIRSDFDRIHASIPELKPQEMVPVPGHPQLVVPYRDLTVLEQKGRRTFEKVFGDEVVDLDVAELLNGVDLAGSRRRPDEKVGADALLRLFYSYSQEDETLHNELETHLKILERRRLIATWHDRVIRSGQDWAEEIDENLERADLILLLVSADFIASDYCYAKEMKRALERHANGEAMVIPIILRDVNWKNAPFSHLQALPKDGKAVNLWPDRDPAWRNVSEGIEQAIRALLKS